MNAPRHDFAPASAMADVLTSAGRIVQGEIALLRAEAGQRATAAQAAIVLGLLGAVLGVTALNLLAGAAVTGLVALGLAAHWAAVVIGGAVAIVAALLAWSALGALRRAASGPLRAVAQVRRDVEILQMMVKRNDTA